MRFLIGVVGNNGLGAIDYPRKGWVVATEAVFPKCS